MCDHTMPTTAAITTVCAPVGVVLAMATMTAVLLGDTTDPSTWAAWLERVGVGIAAAVACGYVAYNLAMAVIRRSWAREDTHDQWVQNATVRWETVVSKDIEALTKVDAGLAKVDAGLRDVCDAIKTCRGQHPDGPSRQS